MSSLRSLVKKFIPVSLFEKLEPLGHLVEAVIANIRYGFPARGMHIIGVTGTNGKTTTTFMIHRLLHEAGLKVAMTSTVAYGYGDDIKPQIEHITTAQAGILQKRLRDFKKAGANWVVVETSSHALAQNRVWGIPYEIAVMTNLTYDHLDYHKTFEKYADAKRKLFSIANKNGRTFGVVNAEDKLATKFANTIKRHVSYGINKGDLRATKIKLEADHTSYTAKIDKDSYDIYLKLIGEFNVSNSLAAIAVAREIGLDKQQIENGLKALEYVEGRVSNVDEGQNFNVFVDFASTPDAYTNIFNTVRPIVKGKLIAVFGSAGRRDESKRAVQGEIAGNFADEIVITEEDDRDIDGNEIMNQIAEGVERAGKVLDKNYFKILDREEAIRFAFSRATSKDDTLLLLGKGHEKTIERAHGADDWNETEVARKLLKELIKR
jgi:UDP-N-acetylmuramoyl-L-alanyl-D-glutamate--2,6-diaminopimelate ligase